MGYFGSGPKHLATAAALVVACFTPRQVYICKSNAELMYRLPHSCPKSSPAHRAWGSTTAN